MFKNRIRLPFFLSKPQFPVERNVFRNAVGATTLLGATVRNTYEGKTDQLPEDWHRKLVIALSHKEVTIEDNRLLTDVVIDGDYGIDWQDFLNYPVAQANFTIQVTPFNASSNNCQSCSQITQLSLVDDYTDDIFDEGQSYEYGDIITANDSICCYPFTIEIVSFNTLFFTGVNISQDGVLTFTVNNLVPTINDVLILTYRVTCSDGSYDEADVYGNLSGTLVACLPARNLHVEYPIPDGSHATLVWTNTPSTFYNWYLYLASDIYTVIQSGGGTTPVVELSGLTSNTEYVFAVFADCDGVISTPAILNFTPRNTIGLPCGTFQFFYVPDISSPPQSVTYVNCLGVATTRFFSGSESINLCLLETTPGNAVYIAASTPDIHVTYIAPC